MSDVTRPAAYARAISKSDTVDFTNGSCRALYIGGAGNVVVVAPDGTTATYMAVPAGTVLPVQAKRINSTNTTATDMLALY
jgi:hypothetical protein